MFSTSKTHWNLPQQQKYILTIPLAQERYNFNAFERRTAILYHIWRFVSRGKEPAPCNDIDEESLDESKPVRSVQAIQSELLVTDKFLTLNISVMSTGLRLGPNWRCSRSKLHKQIASVTETRHMQVLEFLPRDLNLTFRYIWNRLFRRGVGLTVINRIWPMNEPDLVGKATVITRRSSKGMH